MADVNSNININFNTADALAQLRRLQAGLSRFHQSLAEGNLAAANAQKGLNAQLIQSIGATGKFAVSQSKVASSTLAFTNALEKNKLSLREYYRYSMAAATANTRVLSKAFAQEREIINRARRDRVKALQAQYIQMAKAQGGFIEAMRIMPRTLMMANGQFTELGTRIQYAAQRQQFLNQLLKQGSTQLLNFGKNTQWAGRQLMVGLTIPLAMLGGYASKSFRELEEAIVKFRRVYGDAFTNESEVNAAVENIRSLASEYTKFGVAVKDTMDMAATAAAAGFTGADLTRQVETATKLAVLGQVEQQQALETTISLQNAFGLSSEELASKINFLNAVENQTVLSIEDLTIAIPKAAPVIKQLGGNVEDLAFFLTAMKEGGINASEGANALKSGLASLINPTEKAAKFLGEMGINIKGIVEANKGDVKATVVGFARALDTLDPLNRARAIEQLFGKFQFARLSTLFQNVSKDGTQAARAFDLAGASVEELAVLSEREMKKIEESVGVKFQAAVEQFKQDIMPLGKAFLEAVTPIVKFFSTIFEKFNGLSDGTKKVITVITALVAGVGPVLLMTFGLLMNGLANLIKLFAVIRGGIAKLNGQTNILGAGFNYVTQEQLEQQAASQALHNTHTRLIEVFNIEKVAALQLAAAYQQMSTQMRGMAAQNPALFAGGLRGAAAATSKLPKGPVGYEEGIISVPGPKGAGDIVPVMVSPGEAIIPAKTSEKYRGLITAMFHDKIPGFANGRLPWNDADSGKTGASALEKKLSQYAVGDKTQSDRLITQLRQTADDSFIKQLEKLDANRRRIVETAWKGGSVTMPDGTSRSFKPRQSQFLNEISNMIPVKVGNEVRYVHQKDFDKFQQDPAGRAQYARTSQQVIDNMLYRMGAVDRNGSYVSKGGFTGRFAAKDHFVTDLRSTGKGAGGGSAVLSKTVKPIAAVEKSEFLARMGDPLKTRAGKAMLKIGYTPDEVRARLKPELSHLAATKKSGIGGRDAAKFLTGDARYDSQVINRFMNATKRHSDIVAWNDKSNNPLRLTADEISQYKKAAAFMSKGDHPVTNAERRLVAKAAELDQRVFAFKKNGGTVRKNLLPQDIRMSQAVSAVIGDKAIKPSRIMNLSATDPNAVLVKSYGEYKYNPKTRTMEKLTTANTKAKPAGVEPSTGKRVDSRLTTEGPTSRILTGSQALRMAGGRPSVVIPGRAAGDPNATRITGEDGLSKKAQARIRNVMREQERLLRQKNQYSKKEIDNALKQLRTRKVEEEIRKANNYAQQEALRQTEKLKKQKEVESKSLARQARQERVSRYSGGTAMALGTAGMGLMMAGQQTAGMAAMGASAVAGMAPMLTNPYIAAGVAVTALAGSFWLADKAGKRHAEAMSKLVDATSATTEKMQKIGELTNTVGASEIMARRRNQQASNRFTTGFERGKQRFGTTFLESEVGKDVLGGFKESLVKYGTEVSASQMATQLGGYVSDGVLSAEQAHSVAEAIGLNLKNTTLGAQISGQLLELIGPEGQDLLTNPLETRVRLVQQQRETGKQVSQGLATNLSDYSTSADNIFSQLSKLSLGPAGPFTTLGGILQNDRLAPGFLQYSAGEMFGQTQGESMASGAAAIGAQNLEFNQSQIDSLTIQYEKEIAKLEKEKASTANKERQVQLEEKIADLKAKQDSQTSDLRKVNGDILKDQIAAFKVASKRGAVEDAFFDSLKSQVKTKWADDPMAEAFLKTSADLDSKELEVKIDTVVASGQMSPMAAVSLMQMFGDDEKGLDRILTVSSKFNDPGKFMEVINFFGGFKNKEVGKKNVKLITNMARKNPEEADKLMSTLALMQKMDNKEINLEAFFEGEDAQARLADLATSLQQVEDHKGPFTLKALTEVKELGGVNLDGILSRWSEFENLPDEVKKTVIQEYVTLYKTIDDKAINAEIARRVKAAGGASTVADYYATEAGREAVRRDIAGEDTMQKTKQDIASKEAGAYKENEKGGSKQDPYEDIMRRLKNVRNAAINAAGGFKELQKAIAAAGSKSVANKFVGVEQQLMKKGYSDDFINYISGLDPEAQKEFGFTATKKGKTKYKEFDYATGKMKTRTQKYKKGDFVLTDKGNAMRQAMDKAVVGEFQIEQQKVIKNINEQNKAYKTLKAAGLSNLEIEKAMENQAYVTAIATGKITAQELKTNNALTKQALLREQIKGITDKTKVNETRIDALKSAPELINFLSGLKTLNAEGKEVSLSITSIYDAIQDPEDLIRMVAIMNQIKAGTKGSEEAMKELFSFISGAEAAKDLEKNLLTPLEKFQKAYDAAMKIFDAYKQMDEYTLKAPANTVTPELGGKTFKQLERTKTESDEALAAMNAELAIYEHQISMIRDEIAKIESEIENMDVSELDLKIDGQKVTGKLKYVLEDLKEKISDWEREIEMKYERPIKTLQDESNALSNDLQIIDYKADKINEKYDDQVKALEEVQKVNESIIRQQEQQLDLADALTQGDISAAARAAQAMRSSSAEEFATGQTEALAQARENEINALTSASGMTRDQIEERRWEISQQIYALENDPARLALEKSIQEAKDAIYAIEEKREDKLLAIRVHEEAIYKIEKERIQPLNDAINLEALKNLKLEYQLTVLGNIIAANDRNRKVAELTREQWEEMLLQQTLMDEKLRKELKDALDGFNAQSGTAEEIWKRIKNLYDAIKDKTVTITVKYVNEGDGGGSGGGGGGNGDGGNGDGGNGDGGNGDGTGNGAGNGNGSGTGNNTGDNKTGSGTSTGTSTGNTTQGNNALTNATTDINYGLNTGGSTAAMHQADLQNLANKIMVANVTKAAGQTAGSHLNDLINMNARADAFSKSLMADSYAKKGSTATLHLQDLNKTKAQQKASADAFQAELKANAARKAADEAAKKKAAADIKKFGGNAIAASQFANWGNKAAGGLIKRFAFGGTVIGTDTVPAMLTPGEFVMSRYAVNSYGVDTMKAINNGDSVGDSVYNYSINVNVKSDANPDEIAQAVMTNIQRVNSQKLRSVRL